MPSSAALAFLGKLCNQSVCQRSFLFRGAYETEKIISVMLRPSERSTVFSMTGGGKDADIEAVLKSRESLIKYIEDVTNRHDWEFGELKYLSDWK